MWVRFINLLICHLYVASDWLSFYTSLLCPSWTNSCVNVKYQPHMAFCQSYLIPCEKIISIDVFYFSHLIRKHDCTV